MTGQPANLPVIVLGAGGHAKVLIDLLLSQSVQILGITEREPGQNKGPVLGVPVIGPDETIFGYPAAAVRLANGIGSVGDSTGRMKIFEYFKNGGYTFATLIHSSAIVSRHSELGEGAQIMAGAVIQAGCRLGTNTLINTKASLDHDCVIGAHVHLACGVTISGGVWIGDGTHLGTGAAVIQNIRIGRNSLIGAGAAVVKDVPDNAVIMGVPGRVVKYR